MIRHKELIIPAHTQISLERGGKHLMLFNPVKRLKAGETANIKLTTKNHLNKNIIVTIKKSEY